MKGFTPPQVLIAWRKMSGGLIHLPLAFPLSENNT
jgi:hypothetical protein